EIKGNLRLSRDFLPSLHMYRMVHPDSSRKLFPQSSAKVARVPGSRDAICWLVEWRRGRHSMASSALKARHEVESPFERRRELPAKALRLFQWQSLYRLAVKGSRVGAAPLPGDGASQK